MKNLSNICFWACLVALILLCGVSFASAALTRGVAKLGGELCTICLPIILVAWKIGELNAEIKRLKAIKQKYMKEFKF